jgi:hypothetical protein
VIERRLVEAPDVESHAEVILVAIGARRVRDRGVVPLPSRDSRRESFVAVQAALRRDATLSELVTRRAVAEPLELSVRSGERAR